MNKVITTDIELFAAALTQTRLAILQHDFIEDIGIVERYDEYSIKVNGTYYVRSESEFRIEVF